MTAVPQLPAWIPGAPAYRPTRSRIPISLDSKRDVLLPLFPPGIAVASPFPVIPNIHDHVQLIEREPYTGCRTSRMFVNVRGSWTTRKRAVSTSRRNRQDSEERTRSTRTPSS